jgi:hypothetical protein
VQPVLPVVKEQSVWLLVVAMFKFINLLNSLALLERIYLGAYWKILPKLQDLLVWQRKVCAILCKSPYFFSIFPSSLLSCN